MTKFRDEVEKESLRFINFLKQTLNLTAELDLNSYRDYSVSTNIPAMNLRFTVWYSPKKKSYKITIIQSDDPANCEKIQMAWHAFQFRDNLENGEIHAFVDGSFIDNDVGYGLIIIQDGVVLQEIQGKVTQPEYSAYHQVGGELIAVVKFFEWCIKNKISRCIVHYDYDGIYKWATGEWRAKNALTQKYQEYVKKLPLDITWNKVKGHSGNIWNEQADRLAKEAIKRKADGTN
ncbi:MAG: hypothetical protein PHS99_01835 [Candidatus Marinimicrobia bacterium]|nr:hypothetical protein [Candidatus Neomarinimicrobiota bacterium]